MRVRKAVFPAAGLGTRFLPATKSLPKEMLPVVDTPLLQYAVEEVVSCGIEQIVLVTARGKTAMEDHFDRSLELEALLEARGKTEELAQLRRICGLASVVAVRQQEALGLGHAVAVARDVVGDEPFGVVLCDDLMISEVPALGQLLRVHEKTQASVISIEEVAPEATSSYGIIAGEALGDGLFRVRDMVEKPRPADAPSRLGIIGRYVLTPRIFAMLDETGRGAGNEIQLTDALRRLLAVEPVYAQIFSGRRHDAGSKQGYLRATVELALARRDLGKEFRDYLLSLDLGRPAP